MGGLYIHIPFCKQACSYCDFHFSVNQGKRSQLIDALAMEMEHRSDEEETTFDTLYLGGGSPSILSNDELSGLFDALHRNFNLGHLTEITLESNPDDHSEQRLKHWLDLGINRLSIGIQSFIDRDLQFMNRAHNGKQAQECVEKAREAGFSSLSIDLIYGIPQQRFDEWQRNVDSALELDTNHISAYCLTVEPKTKLIHQLKRGELEEKDDVVIRSEYLHLHNALENAGFEHYEISNYAKPGKRAQHNSLYWEGKPYMGIGPSAHSYDGSSLRRWNLSNNARYIKALTHGTADYFEHEILTPIDKVNEKIMTQLRTIEGLNTSELEGHATEVLDGLASIDPHLRAMIWNNEKTIGIYPEHWLMADAIIRALMLDQNQKTQIQST